jgi:L-amino acid N-acyltransferase YncA
MIIRLAQLDDLPAIVDIYNPSIPSQRATGDTQPVRVEDRLAWFAEHRPAEHPIFVSEVDGQVVGWCSLSPYRPGRAALRFTSEISYYITSAFHRQGIGTALVVGLPAASGRLRWRRGGSSLLRPACVKGCFE